MALGAHARDELGISETIGARPVQAAITSAVTFAVGAALPLLVVVIAPANSLVLLVAGTSLFFLALLGARILIGTVGVRMIPCLRGFDGPENVHVVRQRVIHGLYMRVAKQLCIRLPPSAPHLLSPF